jgi:hypothetical protein
MISTALFYGDVMITPTLSVLSAVEGLEVIAPSLDHLVVPLSVVILFCLFAVQSRGTAPGPFRLHGDAERAQGACACACACVRLRLRGSGA